MERRRFSYGEMYLKRSTFSSELFPSILEFEYNKLKSESYGKKHAYFLTWVAIVIFPCYMIISVLIYRSDYRVPLTVNILNFFHALLCFVLLRIIPDYSSYIISFMMSGIFVNSGFAGRAFFAKEEFFPIILVFYSLASGPLIFNNTIVFIGILIRLAFDYYDGVSYLKTWALILFITFIWCWTNTHLTESITRKWFLLLRMKDRKQNVLAARKNHRMMYELVQVEGEKALRIQKRELLSNKVLDDVMDDESTTSYSSSVATTSMADEIVFRESMDVWVKEAFSVLRWLFTFVIIASFIVSSTSWYILPVEAWSTLAYRHFTFAIPFSINAAIFLFFTDWIEDYKNYKILVGILLTVSMVTSWMEAIYGISFDQDSSKTRILATNLQFLLFLRHSFPFYPRRLRIITCSVDISVFIFMCATGVFQLGVSETTYMLTYMILVPFLSEVQMNRVWDNLLEIYVYMKQVDFLSSEIEKEIDAIDKLKDTYADIIEIDEDCDRNKTVPNTERWTPKQSGGDIVVLRDVFVDFIKEMGLVKSLRIEMKTFGIRVVQILHLYKENPFHNAERAISSCFVLKYFLIEGGAMKYFTDLEVLAIMLAGLSHDVGHPGRTNSFLIRTNSELVGLYGTSSTLEQYHVETALGVLGELSFLPYLEEYKKAWMRTLITKTILATDTVTFGQLLASFTSHFDFSTGPDEAFNSNEKKILASMLLCCSSIGYVAFSFEEAETALAAYLNEMYLEGDDEDRIGLGISLFKNRHKNTPYTLFYGFIDQIGGKMVRPLAEMLELNDFVNQMENNKLLFGLRRKGEEL